jgi:hypothetical protein
MVKRDIRTNQVDVSCDICGRTLLRGEKAETYLAGGSRRQVCELCTARAVHEGWIRESAASGELPARAPRGNGRRSLLDRLRQRRERGHADSELGPGGGEAQVPEPPRQPAPAHRAQPVAVPLIPEEPRHVHAVPTNDDLKVARAVELFNGSEHPRTVAGVARSLGAPLVSVHPSREEPSVVSLVVGWELSWYRFEVDLSDEAGGVRIADQGQELGELLEAHRQWNAVADERGELSFAAVA